MRIVIGNQSPHIRIVTFERLDGAFEKDLISHVVDPLRIVSRDAFDGSFAQRDWTQRVGLRHRDVDLGAQKFSILLRLSCLVCKMRQIRSLIGQGRCKFSCGRLTHEQLCDVHAKQGLAVDLRHCKGGSICIGNDRKTSYIDALIGHSLVIDVNVLLGLIRVPQRGNRGQGTEKRQCRIRSTCWSGCRCRSCG